MAPRFDPASPTVINGTNGADTLRYAGRLSVSIDGRAGNDLIQGGSGADLLVGGTGDDTFLHSLGADRFVGGTGVKGSVPPIGTTDFDTVAYSSPVKGSTVLPLDRTPVIIDLLNQSENAGQAAGDRFFSIEKIVAGVGNDTLKGDDTANTFLGMAGNDTLEGRGGNDTLYGGTGNDTLRGGSGVNTLYGDSGNDTIIGEDGEDTVYGGSGNDTIDYTARTRFQLSIDGGSGDDTITYRRAEGYSSFVHGGEGNDIITGLDALAPSTSPRWDLVYGDAGDDTLDFSAMNRGASLSGGDGADTIKGSAGNDTIMGGGVGLGVLIAPGTDIQPTDLAPDTNANDGADTIDGGAGDDRIFGNWGDDLITGSAGRDQVFGGQGNDRIDYAASADGARLFGGEGGDHITGGAGADRISGGDGDDVIVGSRGRDSVAGDGGNDLIDYSANGAGVSLSGGTGDDILIGGRGKDRLSAGDGVDILTGGAGADQFSFQAFLHTYETFIDGTSHASADVITDFLTGVDTLKTGAGAGGASNYAEFKASGVSNTALALQVYTDASHDIPTADGYSYTFIAGARDGYLIVDTNGTATDGVAGVLRLEGLNSLTDFRAGDLV